MLNEEIIDFVRKNHKKKFKNLNDLILFISREKSENFNNVKTMVQNLINAGKIVETTKGKFSPLTNTNLIKGRVIGNSRGFAFVDVQDPTRPDFFIPPKKLMGALNGDIVLIKPLVETQENQEAEVVKILERNNTTVVGTLKMLKRGDAILIPDNNKFSKDVLILAKDQNGASPNQKVLVKINFTNRKNEKLTGEVIEILGECDDFKTLELSLIRAHKLYEEFPPEVIEESIKVNQKITKKDLEGRVDLRDKLTFTIDGADAKDFDDAVSIEKKGDNYVLGVHIADVGNYVKYDSELDKEAYLRGTSSYFPNLVLPMLPEALSNDICSLKENVDRLTLSCIMELDKNAKVLNYKICESVINSKKRFTYDEVYSIICKEKEACEKFKEFEESIILMNNLSKKLGEIKKANGMLDLDVPEVHFELDENEKVKVVKPRDRNEAHLLIENFMVLTNEVIAKYYATRKFPFVYRVHEKPLREKIEAFNFFVNSLGVSTPEIIGTIEPDYVQTILKSLEGKDFEQTCNKVLLRSLQKAKYSEECLGHFGLALEYYCHFTSPIRRYPDLCIHRIIKEDLKKPITKTRKENLMDFVVEASIRSSEREKNAVEAERDVDDLYKTYYMTDHLNEEFEGIISGVQNYGLYVELDNTIEGLVKIENLPEDTYLFYEKSFKLKGNSHCYGLGDKVKVRVIAANMYDRKIDFVLVEE